MKSHLPGIVKFVVGEGSVGTFIVWWQMIRGWACFLYITDGYCVDPCYIDECDHKSQQNRDD